MTGNKSNIKTIGRVLFAAALAFSPKVTSETLAVVERLPIEHGATSQIRFSPSGDKAIMNWPNLDHGVRHAWLIDIASGGPTATALAGPRAYWGEEGSVVSSNAENLPEGQFHTHFNVERSRLGTEGDGVTLLDEDGTILQPDWDSGPVQGRLSKGGRPTTVVAVVGKRSYPIVEPGARYPIKVTLDPIRERILLHGRDGRELIDISGQEPVKTRLPDSLRFTLVPGHDFLLAMALVGGDDHGREPDTVTLHTADLNGKLLESLPVDVDYPDFSLADVMVRCSSRLVLVATREQVYVFGIK